eukprot:107624-Prymnesium_polylepis.1
MSEKRRLPRSATPRSATVLCHDGFTILGLWPMVRHKAVLERNAALRSRASNMCTTFVTVSKI